MGNTFSKNVICFETSENNSQLAENAVENGEFVLVEKDLTSLFHESLLLTLACEKSQFPFDTSSLKESMLAQTLIETVKKVDETAFIRNRQVIVCPKLRKKIRIIKRKGIVQLINCR